MKSLAAFCVVVNILLSVGVPTSTAQSNRGGLSGVVTDKSGDLIPNAIVVITNIGTNKSIQLVTSTSGTYSTSLLDPVEYKITVTAPGFKKSVVDKVKVDTATVATVNVKLDVGGATEEVTVTGDSVLVTDSGTPGQTITERQISEMPLNNRSVLDLMMYAANVSGEMGTEDPQLASGDTVIPAPGYNVSINGGRMGTTLMLADGANNTGTGISRALVTFSPDTVQEFTVQTSNFSAEFGRTGGGVVSLTTKSGSNQYKGLAYWYHRNPTLNAAPWTTASVNRPISARRQHQFGLTFGGPVQLPKKLFGPLGYDGHDKTFFFTSIEPRYYYDGWQSNGLLPNEAMRSGDFSNIVRLTSNSAFVPKDVAEKFGLAYIGLSIYNQFDVDGNLLKRRATANFSLFPNNKIPSNMLDPISQDLLSKYVPKSGEYFMADGNIYNFVGERFIKNKEFRSTIRLDHQISGKNTLSGRYTQVPIRGDRGSRGFQVGQNEVLTSGTDYSWSRQTLLTNTHTFSPTLINELRLNYTYGRFSQTLPPAFDVKTGRNLSTEYGLPSVTIGGLPVFDTGNGGVYLGYGVSTMNDNKEHNYEIANNLSLIKGNMSWKFGVNLMQQRLNVTPMYGSAGGIYNFNTLTTTNSNGGNDNNSGNQFASFLMGVPGSTTLRSVLMPYHYQWNSAAAYVQNDWKVRSNLTLNIGLRHNLFLPRTEGDDLQGSLSLDNVTEYTLSSPVTLKNGTVITKVKAPAYEFAGRGGRSRGLTPTQWKDFDPRFSFAWSPKIFGFNKDRDNFVIRGGYGMSHIPLTGGGRAASPDYVAAASTYGLVVAGATDTRLQNPAYVLKLSSNVPVLTGASPLEYLNIPVDGVITANSLGWSNTGNVISSNFHTPYVQNWSFTLSHEFMRNSVLEVGYVGSKGTRLFSAPVNINQAPQSLLQAYKDKGLRYADDIPDKLGRTYRTGGTVWFSDMFEGAPYYGFENMFEIMNASSNSIRHATTVSLRRKHTRGLSYTVNYTFGKSIDDSSDSGSVRFLDLNVRSAGQQVYGAPRSIDRSVSGFDIKHVFSTSFLYDLPFGRGRSFLASAPAIVNSLVGGWSMSGLARVQGGLPMSVVLRDDNGFGFDGNARTIRPDIVPGVSLFNPNYDPKCPVGNTCEPYFNPAAFMRPVWGEYGNAPRTFDNARNPTQHFFDLSVSKTFALDKDKKRSVQFRVDAINVFNHPIFRSGRLEDAGEIFPIARDAATFTNAGEYNNWFNYDKTRPTRTVAEGKMATMLNSNRVGASLRNDFWHFQVPQDFWSKDINSYDVTTLEGFRLYRLRQNYDGNRWGFLGSFPGRSGYSPRFIQFSLKINF